MRRSATAGRIALVLFVLSIPAAPSQAQSSGQDRRTPARGQQARTRRQAAQPALPEEDCRAYADAVVRTVASGNLTSFNALIDWDAIFSKVVTAAGASGSKRQQLARGLKAGVEDEQGITGVIIKTVREGGHFSFLRVRQDHARQVLLFRLIEPFARGGVTYFEFVPHRSPDGSVRASDIYLFSTGDFISKMLLQGVPHRPVLEETATDLADYMHDLPKIEQITRLANEGKLSDALAELKTLRPGTAKQKNLLLSRVRLAQRTDRQEYTAALEEFQRVYPHDPCLELMMIDYYILLKDHSKALKSVDRLDQTVGGDPYLNVLRAIISEARPNRDAARVFARRAIKEEPTLPQPYLVLLNLALKDKNYQESLDWLKQLDQRFQLPSGDLTTLPEYAGFVKSPEYQAWLAYLAGKAPDTRKALKPAAARSDKASRGAPAPEP